MEIFALIRRVTLQGQSAVNATARHSCRLHGINSLVNSFEFPPLGSKSTSHDPLGQNTAWPRWYGLEWIRLYKFCLALTNSMNFPTPSLNSPTAASFAAHLDSWPSHTTALWAYLVTDFLTQSPFSALSLVGQCMQGACHLLWKCSRNIWTKQGI